MKKRLKMIVLYLLLFVLLFIMAFSLIYSFLNIFVNFGKLSWRIGIWSAFGTGMLFAISCLCYSLICYKSPKSTKFRNWLSQNYPKFTLFFVILSIIFVSIKSEIIWSYDSLKDVISLEWTIFGISIAVFLIWDVVILKYLEKAKPIKSDNMGSIQKVEYIIKKQEFYPQASVMFNTITLVIFNLFVLVIATSFTFVIKEEVTLLNQNFVIGSFYLCINTIIALLIDILQPLRKEKKAILEETKTTSKDIKEKNEIEETIYNAYRLLNDIDKLESIDEEIKLKMKQEIVVKALGSEIKLDDMNNHHSSE